jgi:lysozyme
MSSPQRHGIDVSHHQGTIDWNAVRGAGIQFAGIKATEGGSSVDSKFRVNWANSQRIRWRFAYHYYRSNRTAHEQATNLLNTVGKLAPGQGLCLDVEDEYNDPTEVREIGRLLTAATGRPSLLYAGTWVSNYMKFGPTWPGPFWYSRYTDQMSETQLEAVAHRQVAVWQYTSTGRCPGVSGNCDLNMVFDAAALDAATGLTGVKPPVKPPTKPPPTSTGTYMLAFEGDGSMNLRMIRLVNPNMKGTDAASWQRLLADRGFSPGTIDGVWGPASDKALRSFQKAKGLTVDGVLGASSGERILEGP